MSEVEKLEKQHSSVEILADMHPPPHWLPLTEEEEEENRRYYEEIRKREKELGVIY